MRESTSSFSAWARLSLACWISPSLGERLDEASVRSSSDFWIYSLRCLSSCSAIGDALNQLGCGCVYFGSERQIDTRISRLFDLSTYNEMAMRILSMSPPYLMDIRIDEHV